MRSKLIVALVTALASGLAAFIAEMWGTGQFH